MILIVQETLCHLQSMQDVNKLSDAVTVPCARHHKNNQHQHQLLGITKTIIINIMNNNNKDKNINTLNRMLKS